MNVECGPICKETDGGGEQGNTGDRWFYWSAEQGVFLQPAVSSQLQAFTHSETETAILFQVYPDLKSPLSSWGFAIFVSLQDVYHTLFWFGFLLVFVKLSLLRKTKSCLCFELSFNSWETPSWCLKGWRDGSASKRRSRMKCGDPRSIPETHVKAVGEG